MGRGCPYYCWPCAQVPGYISIEWQCTCISLACYFAYQLSLILDNHTVRRYRYRKRHTVVSFSFIDIYISLHSFLSMVTRVKRPILYAPDGWYDPAEQWWFNLMTTGTDIAYKKPVGMVIGESFIYFVHCSWSMTMILRDVSKTHSLHSIH